MNTRIHFVRNAVICWLSIVFIFNWMFNRFEARRHWKKLSLCNTTEYSEQWIRNTSRWAYDNNVDCVCPPKWMMNNYYCFHYAFEVRMCNRDNRKFMRNWCLIGFGSSTENDTESKASEFTLHGGNVHRWKWFESEKLDVCSSEDDYIHSEGKKT